MTDQAPQAGRYKAGLFNRKLFYGHAGATT
jgi:hypothetical protein